MEFLCELYEAVLCVFLCCLLCCLSCCVVCFLCVVLWYHRFCVERCSQKVRSSRFPSISTFTKVMLRVGGVNGGVQVWVSCRVVVLCVRGSSTVGFGCVVFLYPFALFSSVLCCAWFSHRRVSSTHQRLATFSTSHPPTHSLFEFLKWS